jgi:preprotein translocase subunit SecA
MLKWIIHKIFGSPDERVLKKLRPLVAAVNDIEPRLQSLSEAQLQAKTAEFKEKLSQGAKLDDIQAEAFAVVREARSTCATSMSRSSAARSSTRA